LIHRRGLVHEAPGALKETTTGEPHRPMRSTGHPPLSIVLRLFLAAALGLSGVALVFPATVAHADPTITFHDCEDPEAATSGEDAEAATSEEDSEVATSGEDPEADGCMPFEGQVLRDTHKLRFTVSDVGTFRPFTVRLRVLSDQQGLASPNAGQPVHTWEFSGSDERTQTLTYEWDTRTLTPRNAQYKIRVEVTESGPGGGEAFRERVGIKVDNPPQRPSTPRITDVTEDGPTVEWSKNPEPDIHSYTLYRARTSSANDEPTGDDFAPFKKVECQQSPCTLQDEVDEAGAYWYRVRATRTSIVTPDEGISSSLSRTSEEAGVMDEAVNDDPRVRGEEGNGSDPRVGSARGERPRLTPRGISRPGQRATHGVDGEYDPHLPYDVNNGDGASFTRPREAEGEAGGSRQGVVAAAIGASLVAAGLAVSRMPT
jgi:hypothetical protein